MEYECIYMDIDFNREMEGILHDTIDMIDNKMDIEGINNDNLNEIHKLRLNCENISKKRKRDVIDETMTKLNIL